MWYHAVLTLTTMWLCISELPICMDDRVQKFCSMYNRKLANSVVVWNVKLWPRLELFRDHCVITIYRTM